MKTYSVELNDEQDLAFSLVAASPQEWVTNLVTERCRIAAEELTKEYVQRCLSEGKPIPQTRMEMLLAIQAEREAMTEMPMPTVYG